MEITVKKIPYKSRSDIFEIVPISDIHLGNAGCDIPKLQECVDYIKSNPKAYWFLLGDACECITPSDLRFDPRVVDKRYAIYDMSHLVRRELDDLMAILSPIKRQCLAVFSGNHEEKIRQHSSYDPAQQIAYEMGCRYMGYDGFIVLQFIRLPNKENKGTVTSIKIYANHGNGMGRRDGSKINMISDACSIFEADIICVGHGHKKIIAPPKTRIALNQDLTNVVARKQYGVMTGGFLKGYVLGGGSSYIEKKMLDPSDLGWITISIKPNLDNPERTAKIEIRGS